MNIWNRSIINGSYQKWVLTLVLCLSLLGGFESLAFLTGIYQISSFLALSIFFYIYLVLYVSLLFDLRLKIPRSWARSRKYYFYREDWLVKWLRIVGRALKLRFRYLLSWHHWLHFQNYLVLPAALFWGVVMLIFLNPFADLVKQTIVIAGTLLMAVVLWYIRTFFMNYSAVGWRFKDLMFGVLLSSAFLVFSAMLGMVWYLGLPGYYFPIACSVASFMLMYQGLFRLQSVNAGNTVRVFWGAALILISAAVVYEIWNVNFYSAGLILTDILFLYWGLVRLRIKKRLDRKAIIEYAGVFLFVLLFVVTTTNFSARIG